VVLVFSLIFLLVLGMLGASAALNNSMQERMAGNTRNRDLAFQAAEAALKDASTSIATWRLLAFDGSQAGLTSYSAAQANDANYWRDISHWSSYRSPTHDLNQVAEQPRYRVERMPTVGTTEYYRITARGVGGDANAVVVLQAVYRYTP
jgi:type IV pilus assembly protein PilX